MSDILNEPVNDILNEPIQDKDKLTIRIAVLVDESGSMLGVKDSTITALNSYLDEQSTRDEPIVVSLYTFNSNTGVRNRFRSVNAKTAPRMSQKLLETKDTDQNLVYAPAGGTPLRDAIATVISEETTGMPTLVVILTDGFENASIEYRTVTSIQTLLTQQEKEGWNFVYLMSGLSREESERYTTSLMGRSYIGATMTYAKGMETKAFENLSGATRKWEASARSIAASGAPISADIATMSFFSEDERDVPNEPQSSHVKGTRRKK